jgi:nucleoid DNA-binding protein
MKGGRRIARIPGKCLRCNNPKRAGNFCGKHYCEEYYKLNHSQSYRYLIAQEVSQLAGITVTKAWKDVSTVFRVISEALRSGETVRVVGFGYFKFHTRPANNYGNPYYGGVTHVPERTRVKFIPSPMLLRTLNEEPHATAKPRPS